MRGHRSAERSTDDEQADDDGQDDPRVLTAHDHRCRCQRNEDNRRNRGRDEYQRIAFTAREGGKHHQGHSADAVFPIIGAHVVGMYALVIVIGDVLGTAIALWLLGLGWNLSFVAATAELADRSAPWERGKLLGFNDLLSGLTGASLALVGGVALTALGVAALALGGTVLVVAPALWLLARRRPVPA